MSTIINEAHIKQCSLVITLFDFKNTFGEVHQNLIYEVSRYHHIPDHINNLIKSLYFESYTSVITSDFNTSYIPIRHGVLSVDFFSPLFFKFCLIYLSNTSKVPN